MKKYAVTIQAHIMKTITVEAENEDDAYDNARELFNTDTGGYEEAYEQDYVYCDEIKE